MLYSIYEFNGINYIIFALTKSQYDFVKGFTPYTSIDAPFGYQEGVIYELYSKEPVNNFLANEIIASYKKVLYKIIKKQILKTILVNNAYTQSLYLTDLFIRISLKNNFSGTIDELKNAIENEEITVDEDVLAFSNNYSNVKNYREHVINKIIDFDDVFINETNISEVIRVINNMKNLYQQDPYTFLKENIYK